MLKIFKLKLSHTWLQNRPMNFVILTLISTSKEGFHLLYTGWRNTPRRFWDCHKHFISWSDNAVEWKWKVLSNLHCEINWFSYKNFERSKIISFKQHEFKLIWYGQSIFQSDSKWCTMVNTPNCLSTLFTSSLITTYTTIPNGGRKKNTKFGSHNTSHIQYETIKTLAPIAQSSNWRAF